MNLTKLKKSLLSVIVLLLPIAGFSQNYQAGFIITNDNEKIVGEILPKSDVAFRESVTFKLGEGVTLYLPGQIQGWGLGESRLFTSQIVNESGTEKELFLESIVQGLVSLYSYPGPTTFPRFFIQKRGEPCYELTSTLRENERGKAVGYARYIGTLTIVLTECEETKAEISSTNFNLASFKRLVLKYNRCVAPAETMFVNNPKGKSGVSIGLVSWYTMSKFKVYNSDIVKSWSSKEGFNTERYFSYGINISAKMSKIHDISFNLGALYSAYNVNTTIPVYIRYAYPIDKFKPYITAGYSYAVNLKDGGWGDQRGWQSSLGLEYDLFSFSSVYFELRYHDIIAKFNTYTRESRALTFSLGISF